MNGDALIVIGFLAVALVGLVALALVLVCENQALAAEAESETRWADHYNAENLALRERIAQLEGILNRDHLSITLRGGIEAWGLEFVQWLERQLDNLPGFIRTGKTVADGYVSIHMHTKLATVADYQEYHRQDGEG